MASASPTGIQRKSLKKLNYPLVKVLSEKQPFWPYKNNDSVYFQVA